jgi:molybdate transport system substrate-binding protein
MVGIALAMFAWAGISPARAAEPAATVTSLVAASTQDAMKDVARAFTAQSGIAVKISPGASNALANQILNGAQADLFLSANQEWADKVREQNLAAKVRPLVSNRLVIVVPKGSPLEIKQPADLLGNQVRHVALAGEKVPAGTYAEQALQAGKVYEQLTVAKKIVRGQDVRATLTFVERGEAEAGVVYATDALASEKVRPAYTFDSKSHEPIVYPLVLVKRAVANPAAEQFYEFLGSEDAQKIFRERGFESLED